MEGRPKYNGRVSTQNILGRFQFKHGQIEQLKHPKGIPASCKWKIIIIITIPDSICSHKHYILTGIESTLQKKNNWWKVIYKSCLLHEGKNSVSKYMFYTRTWSCKLSMSTSNIIVNENHSGDNSYRKKKKEKLVCTLS